MHLFAHVVQHNGSQPGLPYCARSLRAGARRTALDSVYALQSLVSLDVAQNDLACAQALAAELTNLPGLRLLHVKGNPMYLQRDWLTVLGSHVHERVRLDVAGTRHGAPAWPAHSRCVVRARMCSAVRHARA